MNNKYVCKGCQRRKPGCKNDCMDYLVEAIMQQPERERLQKQKEQEIARTSDKYDRISGKRRHDLLRSSPVRCKKR